MKNTAAQYEIRQPKDIQEGTANRVKIMLNLLAEGNAKEVEYQLIDLLDSIACRELVVTNRVAPLDHIAIEKMKREEYERGVSVGRKQAAEDARKAITAKLVAALNAN